MTLPRVELLSWPERDAFLVRMRPSQTWRSCGATKRTAGAPFSDGVIVLEGTVHYRASNLEHQMRAAWRPTHLLLGVHPAVHQPLRRAFGDRRRDWLLAPPGRRIINDDIGLPAYMNLEVQRPGS
jgi:hypothetical protein